MDLTALSQAALYVAGAVAVPIAGMLASRALDLARRRLHLDLSADTTAAIERAVTTGAGLLTARLAAGKMDLSNVSLGNAHVDAAATLAMNVAGDAAAQSGLTRDVMAGMIVGAVGKALGEDPTVPTVPKAA